MKVFFTALTIFFTQCFDMQAKITTPHTFTEDEDYSDDEEIGGVDDGIDDDLDDNDELAQLHHTTNENTQAIWDGSAFAPRIGAQAPNPQPTTTFHSEIMNNGLQRPWAHRPSPQNYPTSQNTPATNSPPHQEGSPLTSSPHSAFMPTQ